jgi:Putative porin
MQLIKAKRQTSRAAGILMMAIVNVAIQSWGADSSNTTDPLLDLFIKKGFVTQKEADQVEAEAQAMSTNTTQMPSMPISRWKISNAIKQLELFGDVRLRYEDRSAEDSADNRIGLQRWRYSVRVGLRGDIFDDFYYGVRLDTGANPRSAFVTAGTSASGGPYQGPFGKSNAGINIGQVYLGWKPWDWLNLTVGKMPNPLYTTPMVWSGNLNPEGFAERFKYNVGSVNFFATFGQFLYADLNPNTASAGFLGLGTSPGSSAPGIGQTTDNIFMFAWQGGFNYQITTNVSAKVAATLYNYLGVQSSSGTTAESPFFGDPYVGEGAYYYYAVQNNGQTPAPGYSGYNPGYDFYNPNIPGSGSISFPFNQVGLNHLLVLELPFEFDFKISQLDARVFGDFAYNLEGAQRAEDAANAYKNILTFLDQQNHVPFPTFPAQKNDVKAYQIGFDIGSHGSLGMVNGTVSKRHAWEIKTYWQHIEQYSLDPNLLDTDFFEGVENLQGIYLGAAYGLTDNLSVAFRYGHAWRINDLLGTGGSGQDIPQMNPINDLNIYQVDLTLKF